MAKGCFGAGVDVGVRVVVFIVARGDIFILVFVRVGSVVRIRCRGFGAVESMVDSIGCCDSHGIREDGVIRLGDFGGIVECGCGVRGGNGIGLIWANGTVSKSWVVGAMSCVVSVGLGQIRDLRNIRVHLVVVGGGSGMIQEGCGIICVVVGVGVFGWAVFLRGGDCTPGAGVPF